MMSVVPMMFVRCYCRLRDHVQLVLEILILASLLCGGLQFALALVLALALALTLAFLCTGGLLRLVLEILILASLRDVDVRTMPMVEGLFGRFPPFGFLGMMSVVPMLFVRCYCRLRDHVQLVLEILILASLRDVPMVEVLFGRFPPFGFLGMMS